MNVSELPEDARAFIERVTLHLQSHRSKTPEQHTAMFQEAYKLYAKYDVENRRAAKVEKHSLQHAANCALWLLEVPELKSVINGEWGDPIAVRQMLIDAGCVPSCKITEAAKPKPASAIYGACLDCGTTHEGGCVNTSEAKDKPETSCENCGNGVGTSTCYKKRCLVLPHEADSPSYFANWIPKPKPQTAGEGAIAIEPWINAQDYVRAAAKQLQERVEALENRMREGK